MKYYFAYGSNINPKQIRDRCPEAKFVSKASLSGYRFIINLLGVASIVEDINSSVYGVVWKLSERDEQKLDEFEGVKFNTYIKFEKKIFITESNEINVFIYRASVELSGSPRPGYLERIIQSATDHEFLDEYLKELESWKIQE
jgi:gamma-glutamylcyclotransferase (GGCT)/AIG2-like uncharacterized protein YtfP